MELKRLILPLQIFRNLAERLIAVLDSVVVCASELLRIGDELVFLIPKHTLAPIGVMIATLRHNE